MTIPDTHISYDGHEGTIFCRTQRRDDGSARVRYWAWLPGENGVQEVHPKPFQHLDNALSFLGRHARGEASAHECDDWVDGECSICVAL